MLKKNKNHLSSSLKVHIRISNFFKIKNLKEKIPKNLSKLSFGEFLINQKKYFRNLTQKNELIYFFKQK